MVSKLVTHGFRVCVLMVLCFFFAFGCWEVCGCVGGGRCEIGGGV